MRTFFIYSNITLASTAAFPAAVSLDEAFVKQLLNHDWLGNVRELKKQRCGMQPLAGITAMGIYCGGPHRDIPQEAKDSQIVDDDYHIGFKGL